MSHGDSPVRNTTTNGRSNMTDTRTGGIGIKGTLARPASSVTLIADDEPLNGLETFVRWDDLEEALDAEEFAHQGEFEAHVVAMFAKAEVEFTRTLWESVLAGLMPEYRVLYTALPLAPSSKLDAAKVREIRRRAAAGEKALHLAKEFGVGRITVSDLINRKTWRNVA